MGSSSSKAASQAGKAAAAANRRQYPSTSSILNSATSTSNAPSYTQSPATTNAPPASSKAFAPSQVHPDPAQSPPTATKNPQVELDGRDPQFGHALRRLGPAVPVDQARSSVSGGNTGAFPTSSQPPVGQQGQNIFPSASAKSNPSLMIVSARERIAKTYEEEAEHLGRGTFEGRSLLTAREISEMIRMKMMGKEDKEIERQMKLKAGVVAEMGAGVVVSNV